jgi:hypothetical protein
LHAPISSADYFRFNEHGGVYLLNSSVETELVQGIFSWRACSSGWLPTMLVEHATQFFPCGLNAEPMVSSSPCINQPVNMTSASLNPALNGRNKSSGGGTEVLTQSRQSMRVTPPARASRKTSAQ